MTNLEANLQEINEHEGCSTQLTVSLLHMFVVLPCEYSQRCLNWQVKGVLDGPDFSAFVSRGRMAETNASAYFLFHTRL